MNSNIIYVLGYGGRDKLMSRFFNIELINLGFIANNSKYSYLTGTIKVDLGKSTYEALEDLPQLPEGPSLVLNNEDDFRKISAYIHGDAIVRENIIKDLNEKIKIKHSLYLDGSPVFQFAIKAYANFTNPASDTLTISGSDQLVYAWDEERDIPVGVIIFKTLQNGCYTKAWVIKSFVDTEYRRQGIWKMMWRELEYLCKEQNVQIIEGRVYKSNFAMQKTAESVNRELNSLNYIYKL